LIRSEENALGIKKEKPEMGLSFPVKTMQKNGSR